MPELVQKLGRRYDTHIVNKHYYVYIATMKRNIHSLFFQQMKNRKIYSQRVDKYKLNILFSYIIFI